MTKTTVFPTLEEVLYFHERLIEEHGGASGVRDLGLLESALHRPQSGYYETLWEQAAALLDSLLVNHCFVDGNKRIAWTVTKVFLMANGVGLRTGAATAERFIVKTVIGKRAAVATIARWLEKHST